MKTKIIIWVITLMGIAVTGIIAIQLYWINNAISIKEQEIDRNINKAMLNISEKLEDYYNTKIITSQIETIITDTSGNLYVTKRKYAPPHIYSDSNLVICTVVQDSCSKTCVKKLEHNSFFSPKKPSVLNFENESVVIMVDISDSIIDKKADKLENVVKKMVIEVNGKTESLKDRIRQSYFDSIMKKELINCDITIVPEYCIESKNGENSEKIVSKGYDVSQNKSIFRTPLFTNDIIDKKITLSMFFPEKERQILSSMSKMLILSLFFTLNILAVFTYTIILLYRQKKISEIKSDFINNMTHEFKTPIATISLAADTIENEKVIHDSTMIKKFSTIIKQENKRMNTQIERVLQMSLIDSKSFNLNLQEIDFHQLIQQVVATFDVQIKHKGGMLNCDLKAEKTIINLDEVHFINVIYNILDNAVKYSPSNIDIQISTKNSENGILLVVEDHGMGMTQEQQTRIFDKFYRVATGNIHNVKGFGLGLSYVKAIVIALKGKITVSSRIGEGSKFEIWLPLNQNTIL